ncbi:FAD-dependent oxidoreductase [Cellulomonas soli]|uniref:FAD-dependent oxidoreductase n=1 Tax=Cellulomonas soli TaxID=931535 RepID=UPI003F84478D
MIHDAVVIGAGSAGLSCARTLREGGADIRVVSDTLGGRLAYDAAEAVNFGAYFVMSNYHHAEKLVTRRTRINPLSCRFHDTDGSFATLSGHTLRRAPGLGAFALVMARFMRHYARFKTNCEYMSQREAMELDPYIARLFVQPASEFIAAHRLGAVAEDYVSKFSYACTGVDLDSITALDFCNVSQGLLVPIHRFSVDEQALRAGLGDTFVEDTVVAHSEQDGVHTLTTAGGTTLQARDVVFATPASVTAELLGLGDIRQTCQLYVLHVRGRLRAGLDHEAMNLFPFSSPIIFTAVQDDGSVLVYSREPEVDLDALFVRHELVSRRDWDKAMYVSGRAYVEQQYGPSTYVAGDHNGLGLEPAAISGVYAARQILKKLPR